MATTYKKAKEVEDIAQKLILDYHPHLNDVRVDYLFRYPPQFTAGRIVLGKARKISGLNAFLARNSEPFFVMEIAGDPWETLSARRKEALVDHELKHMQIDDAGVAVVIPHDIEEFVEVIERHGIWNRSLETFNLAAQLALPFDGEEPEDEGGGPGIA
jgi:hypothetical protein